MQTLPNGWVERIWLRLCGLYGQDFERKYAKVVDGIDVGTANAKATWAEELGGFANKPDAIAYALKHLPETPPNVVQFREIARRAPEPSFQSLPHKLTDEQRASNRERIAGITASALGSMQTRPSKALSGPHPHWQRLVARLDLFKTLPNITQRYALEAHALHGTPVPEDIAVWARSHGLGKYLPVTKEAA